MAQAPPPQDNIQFLLSDLNTRIRDAEERNRITKERTMLLGKNLIDIKEELSKEIREIEKNGYCVIKNFLNKNKHRVLIVTDKGLESSQILTSLKNILESANISFSIFSNFLSRFPG